MSSTTATTAAAAPTKVSTPALLAPPRPVFILRGHVASVHCLHFTPGNARLLSADADGWVIAWNLAYKRPTAVWKAHQNSVLGLGSWGGDRVITHGRDNRLLVWQLDVADEANMDRKLPVEAAEGNDMPSNRQPWLVYAMSVNALNFCAFAMCPDGIDVPSPNQQVMVAGQAGTDGDVHVPILLAVSNALDNGGIDVFQLPSRRRVAMIASDRSTTTGMVMCVKIVARAARILIAAGFESGHTGVFVQNDPGASFERLYFTRAHTQPVLSLDIPPNLEHYITSSADANIAKHPLPSARGIFGLPTKPVKVVATKHSGQQGLSYRSDGKIFTTAGWDKAVRVYSAKTLKEVAVLQWHKQGCYATALASITDASEPPEKIAGDGATVEPETRPDDAERWSKRCRTSDEESQASPIEPGQSATTSTPLTTSETAGQQPLPHAESRQPPQTAGEVPSSTQTAAFTPSSKVESNGLSTVQLHRDMRARSTHWLAAGSKDGKISLWDIY